MSEKKSTKVFISHSKDDVLYVQKFVDLLRRIGLDKDNLFCSSVPRFGIPLGQNIFDYLKEQFQNYNLFVIFVLSSNYYKSAAALNEMGAAWVLQNKYISILLPGFEYKEIEGAVNPNNIGLKLGSNNRETKERLWELKERLESEISFSRIISGTDWEEERDKFITDILNISNSATNALSASASI